MAFDLCIVGAGMIGSSAARHATRLGQSVCLIGPTEPKERRGHEIFGAHYDEGRITRSTAFDVIWAVLASRSIARYRQIEAEAGISFYHEVGCLTVGDETSEFIHRSHESAKQQDQLVECLTESEARARFPYLSICIPRAQAIFEPRNAGYINPRLMCEAQQKLAQNGGCRIIREIVNSVATVNDSSPVLSKITTDQGTEVLAKKVLVATGAFTDFRSILPRDLHLCLEPVTQTVIFAELSTEDQRKMKNMPSVLMEYDYKKPRSWAKSDTEGRSEDYNCYILPPIKYPNEKVYLKLGHGECFEKPLNSPEEITNWYLSSVPKDWEDGLKEMVKSRFPDIKPVSFHFDTCATVDTPSGRPYIDLVGTNLCVALGDNGCSAKSCDEIGRLAVSLVVNERWEDDLPKEAFKMIVNSKADSKL